MTRPTTHFLKVFVNADGNFGDLASVILDEGKKIADPERISLTKELNTGETIFVNHLNRGEISVIHTQGEIDFAGVGVLGTAWLLAKLRNVSVKMLRGRGGNIVCKQQDGITWARTETSTLPSWNFKQLSGSADVENLELSEMPGIEHTMFWAWVDEHEGIIRARTFALDWDIPEAEGNGSGSMALALQLDRQIQVAHGKGSLIYARPAAEKSAELGGRVVETD